MLPNEDAQRCAAEGFGLKPRRDRRIRWSKSSTLNSFQLRPAFPFLADVQYSIEDGYA